MPKIPFLKVLAPLIANAIAILDTEIKDTNAANKTSNMTSKYEGPSRIELLYMLAEFNKFHPSLNVKIMIVYAHKEALAVEKFAEREKRDIMTSVNGFIKLLREEFKGTEPISERREWEILMEIVTEIFETTKRRKARFDEGLQKHTDGRLAQDLVAQQKLAIPVNTPGGHHHPLLQGRHDGAQKSHGEPPRSPRPPHDAPHHAGHGFQPSPHNAVPKSSADLSQRENLDIRVKIPHAAEKKLPPHLVPSHAPHLEGLHTPAPASPRKRSPLPWQKHQKHASDPNPVRQEQHAKKEEKHTPTPQEKAAKILAEKKKAREQRHEDALKKAQEEARRVHSEVRKYGSTLSNGE
jgi:hypothetical protein